MITNWLSPLPVGFNHQGHGNGYIKVHLLLILFLHRFCPLHNRQLVASSTCAVVVIVSLLFHKCGEPNLQGSTNKLGDAASKQPPNLCHEWVAIYYQQFWATMDLWVYESHIIQNENLHSWTQLAVSGGGYWDR